jgi:hypothetical protein
METSLAGGAAIAARKRRSRSFLGLLLLGLGCTAMQAQVVIYDTMGEVTGGNRTFRFQAQSFHTAADASVINEVTFRLANPNSFAGTYSFSIYEFDAGSHLPTSLVAEVGTGSGVTLSAGFTPVSFTGLSIALTPSTEYYMVMNGSGSAASGVSGISWLTAAGMPSTSLNTWCTFDSIHGNADTPAWDPPLHIQASNFYYPYLMSVKASAIPEPQTITFLAGLLALAAVAAKRLRRT